MARTSERKRILEEAWIGDAVLALFVRRKILAEDGSLDGPKAGRMTSNQFLSSFGEPSEVEAQIGRVFTREGLAAADEFIEARFMPLYRRQEANRQRRSGAAQRDAEPHTAS